MAKQNFSKDESPKTKKEQAKFIHDYAAFLTERIWRILDEYNVSYNVEYDNQKETIKDAMVNMFNNMHRDFFSLLVGHMASVLAVKPHPEIHKDQNKVLKEWLTKHSDSFFERMLCESRAQKFDEIIKQKTDN